MNLSIIILDGWDPEDKVRHKENNKHIRYRGGFTLIEILLTLVVFTILIVLASQAMDQIMKTYYRKDILEDSGSIEYLKTFWIRTSIEGMLDYMVINRSDRWVPFFKGDAKCFKYVSAVPMVNVFPVFCEIRVISKEDGLFSIEYFEREVLTKTYREMRDTFKKWDHNEIEPVVIAQNVEDVSLSYFGSIRRSSKLTWQDEYDSFKTEELPLAIRLKYKFNGKPFTYQFRIYHRGFLKSNYNELFKKKK